MAWAQNDARWLKIQTAFAVLTLVLFAANILVWRGVEVFGERRLFRPLSSVYLSASLLLQALAPLAGRRSRSVCHILLGSSVVTLCLSLAAW
jgi:hypothetical protein